MLALMQGDGDYLPAGCFERGNQRRQESRFAAAMRADDLSTPGSLAKPTDEGFGRLARGKDERNGAGTNEAG